MDKDFVIEKLRDGLTETQRLVDELCDRLDLSELRQVSAHITGVIMDIEAHNQAVESDGANLCGCESCHSFHKHGRQCDVCGTEPPRSSLQRYQERDATMRGLKAKKIRKWCWNTWQMFSPEEKRRMPFMRYYRRSKKSQTRKGMKY